MITFWDLLPWIISNSRDVSQLNEWTSALAPNCPALCPFSIHFQFNNLLGCACFSGIDLRCSMLSFYIIPTAANSVSVNKCLIKQIFLCRQCSMAAVH